LIERLELRPVANGFQIELVGEIANMLAFEETDRKASDHSR
jgi:hypothetical protein